jgi:hypothetical protein
MPLTHEQFYALPVGAEIDAMKKRFVVAHRDTRNGVEQPVLTDAQNGENLFGAIYICHLMSLSKMGEALEAGPPPEPESTAVSLTQAPVIPEAFDRMQDVDHYEDSEDMTLQPDLTLTPELLYQGRREYPAIDQYLEELFAI